MLSDDAASPSVAMQEMKTLIGSIQGSNADDIIASGLHEFIDIFQYNLNLVDTAIFENYFDPEA